MAAVASGSPESRIGVAFLEVGMEMVEAWQPSRGRCTSGEVSVVAGRQRENRFWGVIDE